ncbi:hypothetical protein DFH29DRAFT_881504 [Suillus ampliporus]|nr:hypothetical protein DFH29DRAFT_881504 [Suillus ampliporus]
MYSNWQELVHPLGVQSLKDFIDASQATVNENVWILYYYVVPDKQVIAWLEDLNDKLLFGECIQPSEWRHKRLELEAQYWQHFEFFPHEFRMESPQVRHIQRELLCYIGVTVRITQAKNKSHDFESILCHFDVLDSRSDESNWYTFGHYQYILASPLYIILTIEMQKALPIMRS